MTDKIRAARLAQIAKAQKVSDEIEYRRMRKQEFVESADGLEFLQDVQNLYHGTIEEWLMADPSNHPLMVSLHTRARTLRGMESALLERVNFSEDQNNAGRTSTN